VWETCHLATAPTGRTPATLAIWSCSVWWTLRSAYFSPARAPACTPSPMPVTTPALRVHPRLAPAAATPAPAAQPAPAEPRKPLVLRLDEIDGPRMTFGASPNEKIQSKELPSLGGDARPLPTLPAGTSGSAFPRDAEKASQDAQ
ncbi:MAG TPA: hypothetical protein VGI18_01295, partial [Burkholderiales bacterium]